MMWIYVMVRGVFCRVVVFLFCFSPGFSCQNCWNVLGYYFIDSLKFVCTNSVHLKDYGLYGVLHFRIGFGDRTRCNFMVPQSEQNWKLFEFIYLLRFLFKDSGVGIRFQRVKVVFRAWKRAVPSVLACYRGNFVLTKSPFQHARTA